MGLPTRRTDLWIAPLSASEYWGGGEYWDGVLGPVDWVEAARYGSGTARRRFLQSRRWTRKILARYAGLPPSALRFRYGRHGKPHLALRLKPGLHFNVSHSRGTFLLAVSRSGPVGVDLEHMRPIDSEWLVECWFSPREQRAWAQLPGSRRREAFFHTWCRKEAFIKAVGRGLAMPLDRFSVSVDPDKAELLEFPAGRLQHWRLSRIDAGKGCAAALVTWGEPGLIAVREIA